MSIPSANDMPMASHAPRAAFAWPGVWSFFAGAVALAVAAQYAMWASEATRSAMFAAVWRHVLIGAAAAIVAVVMLSFVAVGMLAGETASPRPSYGSRSIRLLLLTSGIVFFMACIFAGAPFAYNADQLAAIKVPFLLVFVVAWPVAHLTGVAYGVAALARRERGFGYGVVGASLNAVGLVSWWFLVLAAPPPPYYVVY